jgi:hypothetical protein
MSFGEPGLIEPPLQERAALSQQGGQDAAQ